jgi:hypothetical protein
MKHVWLLFPLLFLVSCSGHQLNHSRQDDAAFARSAAIAYAETSCADSLNRVLNYVTMDAKELTTYTNECRARTTKEHYAALMTAFGKIDSGYAVPAASGPSTMQRIFAGMAAGGRYASASDFAQPDPFGPYGTRGPSWTEFNHQFRSQQGPITIFQPGHVPTRIIPMGPNNIMVVP